ncbi:hypothetical protein ACQKL5_18045 [Peribacillus sp. NPDC097675]|uniref:hypothetical protein n=1 Tax=Peribacillus sp. NPDC097675 TaxID=3390618 RepID=UPI003CFE5E36
MSKEKYKFYYVNGVTEELEANEPIMDHASIINLQLIQNATWLQVGGKHINLANVISIEIVENPDRVKQDAIKYRPNK